MKSRKLIGVYTGLADNRRSNHDHVMAPENHAEG